jgi:hypothetical protein
MSVGCLDEKISCSEDTNPLSRYSPLQFQLKLMIQLACPVKFATCSPDVVSKIAMICASPAAARYLLAGLKATARTGLTSPLSEWAILRVVLLKM